ncbi:MAG: SBBP repeat-containing protein [Bacteroidetes bacterium]|nr:SBBP repeat-containing protein [Bacteroidota bacterium]
MKKIKIFILFVLASPFIFSQDLDWAKNIGGSSAVFCKSMVLDVAGNIYVTGTYSVADFDPGPGTANLTSVNPHDVFIAKYDNSGNYIWAKSIVGTYGEEAVGIKLDPFGNIYLIGNFYNTTDFDPGVGIANLSSNGQEDAFIAKYTNSGNYIWAKSFGSSGQDYCQDVEFDASGNVYVVGSFEGTTDFDPGAGSANLTSAGNWDVYMAKYDLNGNYNWATNMGGASIDFGLGLELDGFGNIYLDAYFSGTSDFDPGPSSFNLSVGSGANTCIAKYNNSGNFIWAKAIGGNGTDLTGDIKLDQSGNIYLAGFFSQTGDFDPGVNVANLTSAGNDDIFIAKYDSGGNYIWAKKNGGINYDQCFSLVLSPNKNIYLTGRKNFNSAADIFILKYDTLGNSLAEMDMGYADYNEGTSIQIDASENIYLSGIFSGTLNIDPNAAAGTSLTAIGYVDMFIAKYKTTATGIKDNNRDQFSEAVIYPNPAKSNFG